MTYEQVKNLKASEFKRLCGVQPETFVQMVEVVGTHERNQKKTGRPGKLSLEDQVLMRLEYWREYRTYFHIGPILGSEPVNSIPAEPKNRRYSHALKNLYPYTHKETCKAQITNWR